MIHKHTWGDIQVLLDYLRPEDIDLVIKSTLEEKVKVTLPDPLPKHPFESDKPDKADKDKKISRNKSKYILEILESSRKRTHLDISQSQLLPKDTDAFKDSRILKTNWKPTLITPNILNIEAVVPPEAPNPMYPEDPFKPMRLSKSFNLDYFLEQNLLPKIYEIFGFENESFDAPSSSSWRYSFKHKNKGSKEKIEFVLDALESEIEALKEKFEKNKSVMFIESMYQYRYAILAMNLVNSFLSLAELNGKSIYIRFRHQITD